MSALVSESLSFSLIAFVLCTLVIALAGTRMALVVDRLADRTGMGEAIAGAVLMGAATSLSGSVLSLTAAVQAQADLALGNSLGGIAVQTAFLSIADLVYRRANLEHAAASVEILMQATLQIGMLAILLVASQSPQTTLWHIHPATFILITAYIYGLVLVRQVRHCPMWRPVVTRETREDHPQPDSQQQSLASQWRWFFILALTLSLTGWVLESTATGFIQLTGLSGSTVGLLITATATSLPELITALAAVRRDALALAIGGIIGGNTYDILFAALSDIFYLPGSIYQSLSRSLLFWIALTILILCLFLIGLIRRERFGIANMGFESALILVLYIGGAALILLT